MKLTIPAALIAIMALAASLATPVFAHGTAEGSKAAHGGVLAEANDLNFELVSTTSGATIYIVDHGKPLATSGASGKLIVLGAGAKAEVVLTPAGENRLEGKGKLASAPGTKAIASITLPGKGAVSVRFVYQ